MRRRTVDYVFLGIVAALVIGGFIVLTSAALGLHARDGVSASQIVLKQGVFLLVGIALMFGAMKIPYQFWKKYSFYIFTASLVISLLLFIPSLGFEHGGARRWLDLGPLSFQPAELLKLGFVVYFSALLSSLRGKIHEAKYGLSFTIVILVIIGVLLLSQPDTGTLMIIAITAMGMYVAAGGLWRHIGIFLIMGLVALFILSLARPYVMERMLTFMDPARDPLGAGYQIQQSLIAIGSGGISGRGFGQSIQKFNYLPEPVSDSVFAVAAEEFGFIGSAIIILLFVGLAVRGLHIARHAPNRFSGLLVTGIVILVVSQSLINIGSMIGVFPLTGMPLLFVSNGGTALVFSLIMMGIVLHISKYQRQINT